MPPELKVEGEKKRTVKVGQPLTLVAIAGDPDNLPARRDGKPQPGRRRTPEPATVAALPPPAPAAAPNSAAVVYRPPVAVVASSGPGLRLSWIVYRGKASAVDVQARSDEDVDGHARVRQLDVVATVHHPRAAG